MQITWKQSDTDLVWPLTVEQKIDIFYEQLWGWQLHVADLIANGGDALEGEAKGFVRQFDKDFGVGQPPPEKSPELLKKTT
jgi:hypothetical protein